MAFQNRRKLRRRKRLPGLRLTGAAAVEVIKVPSVVASPTYPKAVVAARDREELLGEVMNRSVSGRLERMLTTDSLDHFVELLKKARPITLL